MTPPVALKFASPVIDEATIAAVGDVLRSGQITSGPWVGRFEAALSDFCGGRPVRTVTSATAAVEIALQLAGIGPGDEVITCAQSFFTVLNMIVKVGATPVFVDCDPVSRNIDLGQVEARIGPRTRAIIPTHWPGSLVDMDALHALAGERGLRVIEDAALVIGSRWKGTPVGAFGDLVSFSFHPNKNMTSIEGGALVCNDADEARRVDILRFHGIERLPDGTRDVGFPGGKFNLPDVNARIGVAQLERLPAFLERRRALVARYFERFATDPACVLPPRPADGDGQSWNMFCILLPLDRLTLSRKAFRDILAERGIATGVSYEALHLSTLGRRYGYRRGDLPNAERIADSTVTLPLHAAMSTADVDRVCEACAAIIAAHRR
ncbi:MAG: DegT/DnrJ/EryC1/StrS aminotransferase family protein [Betaproteobacteria bacterium]|nr:DegT/DnrJ/EryC1/StrS aminotransferase family protein [Betaproteobacteria bacterium]MDE2208628.1 DegT/DnrJ/EryC1/StrS aminotransferase family protein [Betaproteobacteria bacterium]